MIIHNFIEEFFSARYAYLYNLSAVVGGGRFSFIVEESDENRVVGTRVYEFQQGLGVSEASQLQQFITSDTVLRLNYRMARISMFSDAFALVPKVLFDPQQPEVYIRNLKPKGENQIVGWDRLDDMEMVCVYYMDEPTVSYLQSFFSRTDFYHWATPLLMHYHQLSQKAIKTQVFVHVFGSRHLLITVFDREKLLFSNIYPFVTADDILYYTMLVYDQLKINRERVACRLSGDLMPQSEIMKKLQAYIRHTEFVERPGHYRYGPELNSIGGHLFLDLLSIHLCA